jgi:hypothetical protein
MSGASVIGDVGSPALVTIEIGPEIPIGRAIPIVGCSVDLCARRSVSSDASLMARGKMYGCHGRYWMRFCRRL